MLNEKLFFFTVSRTPCRLQARMVVSHTREYKGNTNTTKGVQRRSIVSDMTNSQSYRIGRYSAYKEPEKFHPQHVHPKWQRFFQVCGTLEAYHYLFQPRQIENFVERVFRTLSCQASVGSCRESKIKLVTTCWYIFCI